MAVAYQGYETLGAIASQIFGKKQHTQGAVEVQTFDELSKMMEEITGG